MLNKTTSFYLMLLAGFLLVVSFVAKANILISLSLCLSTIVFMVMYFKNKKTDV